jgi:hypothetical protein
VMVTARLTLTYSGDRFGVVQPRIGPLGWRHILLYGLLAAPITAGVVYETVELWNYTPHTTNLWKIAAFAPGIVIAFLLLWVADVTERRIDRAESYPGAPALMLPHKRTPSGGMIPPGSETAPEVKAPGWLAKRVVKIPQYSGRGYIDYDGVSRGRFPLLPGHGGALALLLTFVAVYAALGVITSPWVSDLRAPSLAGALLLLTMLNWGLSAAAFFLDRYRVPTLVSILIVTGIISVFYPQVDSYYYIYPKKPGEGVKPQALLAPRNGAKVILVAANGGGIQAAAWSARVLTGIEEACRRGGDCGGRSFASSIRVISAVSGGSVGAMYFANAYGKYGAKDGELPDDAGLERIVKLAERSSLDGVTWGLVYSDFLRMIAPFIARTPFFREIDRARALEHEWQRDADLNALLGDWKRDAVEGKRPGVIFNATIVDNGCPLLFSTIDHDQSVSVAQVFDKLYDGYDASVASAVRLSATFPYITPAARAHRYRQSDWRDPEYHIVDGGYYDNYGVTTLIECLDNQLDKPEVDVSELMVIRIHSMRVVNAPERMLEKKRGFFYQVGVPISALNTVRGAGQLSHGKVEFDLLQKRWRERAGRKVDIQLATFEYPNPYAPLSWHLTDKQKQAIDNAWKEKYVDDPNSALSKVKKFLAR